MARHIHWTETRKALNALSQHFTYGEPVTETDARRVADREGIELTDDQIAGFVKAHNDQPADPFQGLS